MFQFVLDTAAHAGASARIVSSHPTFPRGRVEAEGLALSVCYHGGRAEVCPLDGSTIPKWVVDPLPLSDAVTASVVVRAWVSAALGGDSAQEAWDAAEDAARRLWDEA